jgi:thiamine biosynthesis lipoprotein
MGSPVTLTVLHPERRVARGLAEAAFDEMERLEGILSRHRADTALSALNREGVLRDPPRELVELLRQALAVAERSRGGFDPTVGPLVALQERSFREEGRPPRGEEVAAALARVDFRAVRVSVDEIRLDRTGMSLTLDGIAKGFIVDRVVARLARAGADELLVNAAGDMAAVGGGEDGEGWSVGIEDPRVPGEVRGSLRLGGGGVATSGDYLQRFTADGVHHHILDPRTGESPVELTSVTVLAPSAMLADALATGVMVLGARDGLAWLDREEGVEGEVMLRTGEVERTRGWG